MDRALHSYQKNGIRDAPIQFSFSRTGVRYLTVSVNTEYWSHTSGIFFVCQLSQQAIVTERMQMAAETLNCLMMLMRRLDLMWIGHMMAASRSAK